YLCLANPLSLNENTFVTAYFRFPSGQSRMQDRLGTLAKMTNSSFFLRREKGKLPGTRESNISRQGFLSRPVRAGIGLSGTRGGGNGERLKKASVHGKPDVSR
ncbi:MAG TPA: hypothetical protein VIK98_06030, partial [Limnochordales bacterium]